MSSIAHPRRKLRRAPRQGAGHRHHQVATILDIGERTSKRLRYSALRTLAVDSVPKPVDALGLLGVDEPEPTWASLPLRRGQELIPLTAATGPLVEERVSGAVLLQVAVSSKPGAGRSPGKPVLDTAESQSDCGNRGDATFRPDLRVPLAAPTKPQHPIRSAVAHPQAEIKHCFPLGRCMTLWIRKMATRRTRIWRGFHCGAHGTGIASALHFLAGPA